MISVRWALPAKRCVGTRSRAQADICRARATTRAPGLPVGRPPRARLVAVGAAVAAAAGTRAVRSAGEVEVHAILVARDLVEGGFAKRQQVGSAAATTTPPVGFTIVDVKVPRVSVSTTLRGARGGRKK